LQPVRSGDDGALAHPTILGLLVDHRGQLWVDTPEGLHRMLEYSVGQTRFERTSARLGIAGRPFGANLLEDERGRLWTHEFVYDPAGQRVHELSIADGVDIGTGWFRAYAKAPDGRMYFGGSKGLLVVDPERFDPRLFAPPVVATELKIDGVGQPAGMLGQGLELASDQRSFSIEFAALDYSAPERNRYRYRLLGFDERWIDTDASYRVASYSNLWPGAYTLEVQGSNRGGMFAEQGLRIPVRVLPAYWQSPWFAALVLLGLGALTYAGIRWRTARVDARARELQRVIEERTSELRSAKDSAEQALAELTGAQRQLIASEKMASLGALVAGIAHEINTPIGIAVTAASHLQDSSRSFADKADSGKLTRSDLVTWRTGTEEACRLILGSLQRANTLIGSFKQVAVDQSSEQRRCFELRSFLEEVQTSLRPIYRRTPYTLSVECADGIQLDTYPGALFQIFTNLVNNSLLHGFHQRERGSMQISAQAEAERVILQYSDDGHGMHAAVAEHAFDPFYTTRRGSGGSGLGLHLVNNLVAEMLGGRISLQTQPGQGCRFIIELPLRAP
jgi:signal transduction histidine kinase